MARDQVFISYSHADRGWYDRFTVFLKGIEGIVDVWSDRDIPVSANWFDEIVEAIARTKVALLLVTQNFLASDFIAKNELDPFLAASERDELKIYWVAVEYST